MARTFPFIYVSGGCRSGKSAYAQTLAERLAPRRLYLATCDLDLCDEDMRERVRLHQAGRRSGWRTHECPQKRLPLLAEELAALVRPGETLLLDCLSLWAAACMEDGAAPPDFNERCEALATALSALPCPVVTVNSEVGMGLAPPTRAGRAFRDMTGLAGQKIAATATAAVFMVSGLPLPLKGMPPSDAAV